MKKILVLGATGMAGHTITLYLLEKGYDVTSLSRKPFNLCKNIIGDVFDVDHLTDTIKEGNYDVVINCIGLLNENAENNKSKAVFINSYIPHLLCEITHDLKTKIIHMSTDCVFSGKTGPYYEHSSRDGESFYDRSKALGEIDDQKNLTFRNSIIGPDINSNGIGLFNWFMKQTSTIKGYSEVYWTGVTTLTLAKAMEKAIECNLTGIYNLVNNQAISKKNLLKLFNNTFNRNINIIDYDMIKSKKILINTRKDFCFTVPSYDAMIKEMKDWIEFHKDLYPLYYN